MQKQIFPLNELVSLQLKLANKVISKNFLSTKTQRICGVDCSYSKDRVYCSAVIIDKTSMKVINTSKIVTKVFFPYIPGFFMFREGPPILQIISSLADKFDVLLVDGHGILHPRGCGIASFVGLIINKPVIGIAKRLLCGYVRPDSKVIYNGKIVGCEVGTRKKIYVSVGNKISLKTAIELVKNTTKLNQWYPEPLRLADKFSRE